MRWILVLLLASFPAIGFGKDVQRVSTTQEHKNHYEMFLVSSELAGGLWFVTERWLRLVNIHWKIDPKTGKRIILSANAEK